MIARGNLRQVSFLHVYHHVSISLFWWAIAYCAPGGEAWYSLALNSLVHVLMYSYYLLASIGGADAAFKRRWLWWRAVESGPSAGPSCSSSETGMWSEALGVVVGVVVGVVR